MQVLSDRAASGAVVLFSSHQLDVVERLCDDLVIIGDGRVLAAGDREDLRRRHGTLRYELTTDSDLSWAQGVPGIHTDEAAGNRLVFQAEEAAAQHLLQDAVQRGPVRSFTPVLPTLTEIFRDFTNDSAPTVPQEAAR